MKPQITVLALISIVGVCDAKGKAWFYTGEFFQGSFGGCKLTSQRRIVPDT